MKELKKVANMLGTMLTKEEVEEFMAEADVVNIHSNAGIFNFWEKSNPLVNISGQKVSEDQF